jgi:hypothetical protein
MKEEKTKSAKFTNWLLRIEEEAMRQDISELQSIDDELADSLKGWYNSGYTPKDIVDNSYFILNPSHP